MKNRRAIGGVLAVIIFITLAFLAPPIRPPKARASRVAGVNNVRSVTLTFTNVSALPGAQPGIGK